MNKTRNKAEQLEAEIERLAKACKLDGWNSFVNDMAMPADLFIALSSGRSELIRLIKPRALTAEEAAPLFNIIATLIETNMALRDHAAQIARMVKIWTDAFKQLHSVGGKIECFAEFKAMDHEDA